MIKIIRALSCIRSQRPPPPAAGPDLMETNGAQYIHRSDTITLSAGNAKDVNAATQVIDPWPRNVGNRRIPANGERMVGAVQRYQRSGAARSQGQIGQPTGPGGSGAPPPGPPSGARFPPQRCPIEFP